jgi:hypothetical protein
VFDQNLLLFILSLFLFSGPFIFILSPCYSIRLWLHGPVGLDLCSLQPQVFEAFYELFGADCVRNLSFRMISSSCDPVQCWYAFVKHP